MQKIYLLRIMKHTHKYLIFAISIFLVSLLTLGCQEKEEKKIVLIHSFEQKKDTYPIFNETLKRTFDKPDSIERYCRILESYEHRHRAQYGRTGKLYRVNQYEQRSVNEPYQ